LPKVIKAIEHGTIQSLDKEFQPFTQKHTELSIEYGGLMWGYRTIVPKKLCKEVLESLHRSHLGIVKTKALARNFVWWPGLDKDTEYMISKCDPCQKLMDSPSKSALIPWNPEESVWKRIHVDFDGPIRNHYFMVVVDSYSKWSEVVITKQITSNFTVEKLREMFCRYGLIDVLVTNNVHGSRWNKACFNRSRSSCHERTGRDFR